MSHFEVNTNSSDENDHLFVHFDKSINLNENEYEDCMRDFSCNLPGDIGISKAVAEETAIRLYRRMGIDEVQSIIQNKGFAFLSRGKKIHGIVPERIKWISEAPDKAIDFVNNGVPYEARITEKIAVVDVNKDFYEAFREKTVPNFNVPKDQSYSRYNFEGIFPVRNQDLLKTQVNSDVPRNVGIHSEHLSEINQNITSIKFWDPNSEIVKNNYLRYLSENKLMCSMIALDVIIQLNTIRIAILEADGSYLKNITLYLCDLTFGKLGQAIGGLLGNIVPGVGNIIGSILGNIIFGLIGKKVKKFICSIFDSLKVAPGPGCLPTDYINMVFDDQYGLRELPYDVCSVYGTKELDYDTRGAVGVRRSDYSATSYRGIRKSDYL